MSEDKFVEQVNELLEINNFQDKIEGLVRKAYKSGAINTEDMKEGDFRKAKIVLSAIFNELHYQFRPFSDDDRNESKNLEKFI
jgi:hypothetical protein